MTKPTVLVTGAAKRIGAELCRGFHRHNFNVVIHYQHSQRAAEQLQAELESLRPGSAISIAADLNQQADIEELAHRAQQQWQGLDVLINNASCFYPKSLADSTEQDWDAIINSNLKAPYFLCQALSSTLQKNQGSIINMADIYADKPLDGHGIYNIAKAGNVMLTKTLAKELAPDVRVNGIAPGAIAWPEHDRDTEKQQSILAKIPLQKIGGYQEIVKAALYLTLQASYTSGQILSIDGGRSLSI